MALCTMESKELQEAIDSGEIVLAYFWADWQENCSLTTPIMEELGQRYDGRAIMASINADELGFTAVEMNLYPLPMTIVYEDGMEVDRISGPQSIEIYDHVLKTYVEPDEPNPYELITSMGYTT